MTAIISPCGLYRYRLECPVAMEGPVYAFFGINPSTADASLDDATVRKWIGFCKRWGASRFIVGNAFAYRATDVKALATVDDPYGPDIGDHVTSIIEDADILVPCWGNTTKVPPELRDAFDVLMDALVSSGKPVMHFGLTNAGDPKHPLMLGYDTPLVPWAGSDQPVTMLSRTEVAHQFAVQHAQALLSDDQLIGDASDGCGESPDGSDE